MAERYVPVPYRALDVAGDEGIGAVAQLYRRAHSLRWGWFPVTERELARAWRLTNRKVWALLDGLVVAGLIEVQKGDKRRPTKVRVADPATLRQPDQQPDQQNDAAPRPTVDERAAQNAAQNAASCAEGSRARSDLRPDPDQSPEDPPQPPADAGGGPTEAAAWVRDHALELLRVQSEAAEDVEPKLLEAWRKGHQREVKRWTKYLRGEKVGMRHSEGVADAPSGIRTRDIAAGLALAAAAWSRRRAEHGPPPQPSTDLTA